MKAIKVKCGFDHSLIMIETKEKVQKLYSVGQEDVNFHHLGISANEAEEKKVYFREIQAFSSFNIVDFSAGHRTSHVILEGEKEATENLYTH